MSSSIVAQLREMKTLLSPEQLAPLLGIQVGSLAARRVRKQAPAFVKVGAVVRYDPAVVADWLQSQTVTHAPTPNAPLPTWLQQPSIRKQSSVTGRSGQ